MNRLSFVLMFVFATLAFAVEIDPVRRTVPERFTNPPGKRFSIFSGDPERVQKANEINVGDFEGKVEIINKEVSLAEIKTNSERKFPLEVKFYVHNKGNRSYTLSFPDAQRYDLMIKDSKDQIVYVWSDDKMFVKEIGKTFMNKNETICYTINPPIQLPAIASRLPAGEYKVTIVLCNYPEIMGTAPLSVKP